MSLDADIQRIESRYPPHALDPDLLVLDCDKPAFVGHVVVDGAQPSSAKQVAGTHYLELSPQPWDVVDAWKLGFYEGNVLKYLARWKAKGGVEDLKKARHYLDRLIERGAP